MALNPKLAGHVLSATTPNLVHSIELYLDYVCPFSKKMFDTIYAQVLPTIMTTYASKVSLIFRQQNQPWHPSSTLTHESALAVNRLRPDKFWEYSAALFAAAGTFYDVPTVNETRNATYERLAEIAGKIDGVDGKEVMNLLRIPEEATSDGSTNAGNEVTGDVKLVVKMARLVGVHVSPTVIVDGVVDNSISSSFTGEQWLEYLKKLCA